MPREALPHLPDYHRLEKRAYAWYLSSGVLAGSPLADMALALSDPSAGIRVVHEWGHLQKGLTMMVDWHASHDK